jgi:hypothetical protein
MMKFQRFFSLCGLAVLLVTIAAIAQGQSSRASEIKRRVFNQVSTGARKPVDNAKTPAPGEAKVGPNYGTKNALAGTWDLVLTFSDGSQVKSTLQIMLGAAEGEGSVLHASEFSFAPPNPTLPEQGSWQHVHGREFLVSYYGYSYDELFQPFGKIGFRGHLIGLSKNQQSFTGKAIFEVIDNSGQVLFTDNITTSGVRQRPLE